MRIIETNTLAAALCLGPALTAQDVTPPKTDGKHAHHNAKSFLKKHPKLHAHIKTLADKDGDGKLNAKERAVAHRILEKKYKAWQGTQRSERKEARGENREAHKDAQQERHAVHKETRKEHRTEHKEKILERRDAHKEHHAKHKEHAEARRENRSERRDTRRDTRTGRRQTGRPAARKRRR